MLQNNIFLNLLNGTDILYMSIIPISEVTVVVKSAYFWRDISKTEYIPTQITSAKTIVKAVGSDLPIIFLNSFPLIRSLFGSSASTNEGIPIVTVLISVICIGMKG